MQEQPRILIKHLYISPGHNYFGHHEQVASKHPIVESQRIRCLAGRGIEGDRFLDYKKAYKGQITFFELETYTALCQRFSVTEKYPGVFRRNVITCGVDLASLIGTEFEVQGVRFFGTEESRPCYWMESAFAPGAEEALRGHGGLRARILTDGLLQVDA
jgi:MOSC domain-containing protein YiiM